MGNRKIYKTFKVTRQTGSRNKRDERTASLGSAAEEQEAVISGPNIIFWQRVIVAGRLKSAADDNEEAGVESAAGEGDEATPPPESAGLARVPAQ